MSAIQRGSSTVGGIGAGGVWLAGRWAFALVAAGVATASGCWLDRVVDVPTVQDGGAAPGTDAGRPPPTGSGGCQWVAPTKSGCALTSVSCNQLTACPPSWMQANSAGSCPQAGTAIATETCEGMYRWSLVQGGSNYMPGDGTLVAVCYYDMSTGLLAGIDSQVTLPCGTTSSQFGTVPQWCHYDAGVAVQRFACSSSGSGQPLHAGISCSQEMPCHGGG